jgi:phosphohistidine phosphatase
LKKLLIIRHAKSSWSFPGLNDHDRPLNDRGKKDVKKMGKVLISLFKEVQFIYCSSAKRAQETLFGLKLKQPVETQKSYYTFDVNQVMENIQGFDDNYEFVAMIGHNPALSEFINAHSSLTIENLPTCGAVLLQWSDIASWKEMKLEQAKALAFITPKSID